VHDFDLIWHGKRYGVARCVAGIVSKTIADCENSELAVPSLFGPFHMVLDVLHFRQIVITPETELFLSIMGDFLQIKEIVTLKDCYGPNLVDFATVKSFCEMVSPGSREFDDACTFLGSHLHVLLDEGELGFMSSEFVARITELMTDTLDDHDDLLSLITYNGWDDDRVRLLQFVDLKKVSQKALSSFISNPCVDLEAIRDFLARVFDME
jgi:hypothetical protein